MVFKSEESAPCAIIMVDLASRRCLPCERGVAPFTRAQAEALLPQVPNWVLNAEGKGLQRSFMCKDFKDAISFVQTVAELAEAEGHHPDIAIHYRKVTLTLTTHAIKGLSENDFILAAKISKIHQSGA